MRSYLVVAHKTLVDEHLLNAVEQRLEQGRCRFHLVVPVVHPWDHSRTDGEDRAAASERLREGLFAFRTRGAHATGEVGEADPVRAVHRALESYQADEIIFSTLRPGVSRWLRADAVHRVERSVDMPVVHVYAVKTLVG